VGYEYPSGEPMLRVGFAGGIGRGEYRDQEAAAVRAASH
jgi:hypothetical protein